MKQKRIVGWVGLKHEFWKFKHKKCREFESHTIPQK